LLGIDNKSLYNNEQLIKWLQQGYKSVTRTTPKQSINNPEELACEA
jgi:hypothetical protein